MRIPVVSVIVAVVLAIAVTPMTAGDPANAVRTVFSVQGMHCDGCSATITGTLERTEGVLSATADHETGTAEAVYRPKTVSAEELKAAIERLGYTVTAMDTTSVDGDDASPAATALEPRRSEALLDGWPHRARADRRGTPG